MHVTGIGQCHPKTICSQCHQSQALQYNNITVSINGFFFALQALQLTVDSFQKRIFALQITDNSFGKEKTGKIL